MEVSREVGDEKMNKAQQRLDEIEKELITLNEDIDDADFEMSMDNDLEFYQKVRLEAEKQGILLGMEESYNVILLIERQKIIKEWNNDIKKAKVEGRKEISTILFDKFEKLVKECYEKGLATEMIITEGLPNLKKEMDVK